jgi:hypothetical protein
MDMGAGDVTRVGRTARAWACITGSGEAPDLRAETRVVIVVEMTRAKTSVAKSSTGFIDIGIHKKHHRQTSRNGGD